MNFYHKESKSKKKIFFILRVGGGGGGGGWGVVRGAGGGVDGWTDKQAQTNLPLQLLRKFHTRYWLEKTHMHMLGISTSVLLLTPLFIKF